MAEKKKSKKSSSKNVKAISNKLAAFASLRVEDLDENVLQQKIDELEKDLEEYREKCFRLKKENDWYRDEIEASQKDTDDYVAYLESKRMEKQSVIDSIMDHGQRELEMFMSKKKRKEVEHLAKIRDLKQLITELEVRIETRNQEIMSMSDILSKRARHEVEIAKIKKEMKDMEKQHKMKVEEIERNLVETRTKLHKEAEDKIHSMESEAQQKATNFLLEHTHSLEDENRRLEKELREAITLTHEYAQKKQALERQNQELKREQQIRDDMIRLRLKNIVIANEKRKEKSQDAKGLSIWKKRHQIERAKSLMNKMSIDETAQRDVENTLAWEDDADFVGQYLEV